MPGPFQRVTWQTYRGAFGGAFLAFCAFSLVAEFIEHVKMGDALRRSRSGLANETGIPRPAKTAAAAGATYAARGVPPVLADQLDNLGTFPTQEPTYQPVMILGDKPLQCQCGARAVFMVLEHEDDDRPAGAPAVAYGFGGFCVSCWQKLDQLGKF